MIKELGQKRPSQHCFCESPDGRCFDRVEKMSNGDLAWTTHCKALKILCDETVGKVNRIISKHTNYESKGGENI